MVISTRRAGRLIAVALLMFTVSPAFAAAAQEDDLIGRTEQVETVASGRILIGDAPCVNCRVSVYEPTLDVAYAATTDGTGSFQVVGLQPGKYIFVADGPDRHFSLSIQSLGTQAIGPFTVAEGHTLTGLLLQAPTRIEAQRSLRAFTLPCGATPPPLVFNGQVVATFTRPGDEVVADTFQISCPPSTNALGCTEPAIPSTTAEIQCLGSHINVKPWVLTTTVRIHGPGYNGFGTEPPPPDVCTLLTSPTPTSCDQLPYASYEGVVVHECAHRVGDEKYSHRQWETFLNELKAIQEDLQFCAPVGACSCESEDIRDRIAKALARLKGKLTWRFFTRTEAEAEPERLECAHYTAQCAAP